MQSGVIREHLERVLASLLSKAAEAGIFHNPTLRGTAREIVVADFLRDNLPGGFRFDTGEVVTPLGEKSGQVDILIVPDSVPRFRIANQVLALAHGVAAAIEVKSNLTASSPDGESELTHAIRGCEKIKKLAIVPSLDPWPWAAQAVSNPQKWLRLNNIPVSIVAFDGPTQDTLRAHLHSWSQVVTKEHLPNTITVLKRGYTLCLNDGWRTVGVPPDLYWAQTNGCLFDVFDHLMKVLQAWNAHPPATPLSAYI